MILFTQFCQLFERKVDPVRLAQRASRRYGTRSSFGTWEKVPKGGHIPLTSFDEKLSSQAAEALYDLQMELGMEDVDKKVRDEGQRQYDKMNKQTTLNISQLVATQPYVMTNDVEKLRDKITNTNPNHIHVVKYAGRFFISDGHHAVVAAQLRGEKQIKVSLVEIS